MDVVRTPDENFAGLPDYPFEPNYCEVPAEPELPDGKNLRVHYLDEGPADAAPVLLMHGEPSWSYLYRHMIPPIVAAGHRVIAPDLVGFGRSDKPTEMADYSYARHVAWMSSLVFDHLDLRDITFFGQDWGGLVGLRLVAAQPDRYARLVVANTGLPSDRKLYVQAGTYGGFTINAFNDDYLALLSGVIGESGSGSTFITSDVNIQGTTGVHTVYLTFESGQPADFVNVNWFTFG